MRPDYTDRARRRTWSGLGQALSKSIERKGQRSLEYFLDLWGASIQVFAGGERQAVAWTHYQRLAEAWSRLGVARVWRFNEFGEERQREHSRFAVADLLHDCEVAEVLS